MVYEAAANMISIVSPLNLQQEYLNNLLDKQNKAVSDALLYLKVFRLIDVII